MNTSSPVVCQIPDCMTTQAEIESELQSFLWGYCSICKKERGGRMCGCAYPCSLAFRGQMLLKIHELLGMEKPTERRAIQVCFKHPDLLKQAREACIAKNHGGSRILSTCRTLASFSGMGSAAHDRAQDFRRARRSKGKEPLQNKHQPPERSKPTESEPSTSAEILRIQYGSSISFERNDDGREEVRIERLFVDDSDDHDEDDFEELPLQSASERERESPAEEVQVGVANGVEDIEEIDEQELEEIERDLSDTASDIEQVEDEVPLQESNGREFKIRYEDYPEAVLFSGLRRLKTSQVLGDVKLVCSDRKELFVNSLVLGSMSTFLRDVLIDVPEDGDEKTTLILPEINSVDLALFLRLLFDEKSLKSVGPAQVKLIRKISKLFQINAFTEDDPSELLADDRLHRDYASIDVSEENIRPTLNGGRGNVKNLPSNRVFAKPRNDSSTSAKSFNREVALEHDTDSSDFHREIVTDEFDLEEVTEFDLERDERIPILSKRKRSANECESSDVVVNEATEIIRVCDPGIRSSLKRSNDQHLDISKDPQFGAKSTLHSEFKNFAPKRKR